MPAPVSIAVLLGLSLLFGGCERGSQSPSDAIRIQIQAEPVTLDPSLAEDGVSLKIIGATLDGLVGYDQEGKLVNRLAESYSVSADGRSFDFIIRNDAKWSDGKPVMAEDFETGLNRSLDPSTPSKLAALLKPIQSVKADGKRLKIILDRPAPYFVQALTIPAALPQRRDVLHANGMAWPRVAPATGPFQVVKYVDDQKVVLAPNPHWQGPGQGPGQGGRKRSNVEFLFVSDESTALHLFEQGKVHVLSRLPTPELARLRKEGVIHQAPFIATFFIGFNTRIPPFNSRAWRRAIAGAIHREELARILETGESPARSWIPPGIEGHEEWSDPRPGLEDAITAIGKLAKTSAITAAFDTSARNATLMEKIQSDLKSELGLNVKLANLDWKTFVKTVQTSTPQIFRMGWLAPFMDPLSHLQMATTGNPNNHTGWSHARYDSLVREIEALPPGPARLGKIREAQRILVDDEAPIVPLYHYLQTHAVSKDLKGFRVTPFGVILLSELERAH